MPHTYTVHGPEQPSDYEAQALNEIRAWKDPANKHWLQRVEDAISAPFDWAGDAVMKVPGVELAIEKTIGGLLSLLNDAAQWTQSPEITYEKYRKHGFHISEPSDILKLDLEEVDKSIGWLAALYKGAAGTEGAATGAVGLPGIPVDVIALTTLNLRAIGDYATHCGFNTALQQERIYALGMLSLASSPNDAAKQAAMVNLVKIATDVAKKKTWKELEEHVFVRMVQQAAKSLGIRLTKGKLAQVIPATGAVIGGGFNIYYTSKVCDASYYLYRERFLAAKYGPEVLE